VWGREDVFKTPSEAFNKKTSRALSEKSPAWASCWNAGEERRNFIPWEYGDKTSKMSNGTKGRRGRGMSLNDRNLMGVKGGERRRGRSSPFW